MQSKALAQHVVQPFLESVEGKILNSEFNTANKTIPWQIHLEWIFFYLFHVLLYNKKELF
jgi:hypothetical protein